MTPTANSNPPNPDPNYSDITCGADSTDPHINMAELERAAKVLDREALSKTFKRIPSENLGWEPKTPDEIEASQNALNASDSTNPHIDLAALEERARDMERHKGDDEDLYNSVPPA